MKTGIVKAGMVLNFTNGCYSDYTLQGTFVACENFNYMDEFRIFYKPFQEKIDVDDNYSEYDIEVDHFINFLLKKEFIVLCSDLEIHLGDYNMSRFYKEILDTHK